MPLLATAMWLPSALDQQLETDAGISNFEYGVLAGLSMQEGRTMRMSDLARIANSALPRLSKVVDRLERNEWVSRQPDPADGRSTLVILTDKGTEKVVATAPGHVARVRELVFDRLTPAQVRQLGVIAAKISAAARPDVACSPASGRDRKQATRPSQRPAN
jgi:DNA-binding MarR family transcriptional regulator